MGNHDCLSCRKPIEEVLVRLGSTRCLDCRTDGVTVIQDVAAAAELERHWLAVRSRHGAALNPTLA
jgi:hypothetical protein